MAEQPEDPSGTPQFSKPKVLPFAPPIQALPPLQEGQFPPVLQSPSEQRVYKYVNPIPLSDIDVDASAKVKWLWQDFIPENSLVLLNGYAKEGKSTFVYDLLAAVRQGSPFLGRYTKRTGVLVLALEENQQEVSKHLQDAGIDNDDGGTPFYVQYMPVPCTQVGMAEFKDWTIEKGIGLLVIDTLSQLISVKNENDNAEVRAKIDPVRILAHAHPHGLSVLPLHHTKKPLHGVDVDDGSDVRGASTFLGIVDSSISLKRARGGNKQNRVLRSIGRQQKQELLLGWQAGVGYTVLSEATIHERVDVRRAKIQAYVTANPGLSRRKVVEGVKTGKQKGLQAIETLLGEGLLEERAVGDGKGIYAAGFALPGGSD